LLAGFTLGFVDRNLFLIVSPLPPHKFLSRRGVTYLQTGQQILDNDAIFVIKIESKRMKVIQGVWGSIYLNTTE
jgi:hypothetical protein